MADIVELNHPDNVELVAGASQNWVDLGEPAASTAALRRLVTDRLDGVATCLVVGPHDVALLRELEGRVGALTVVVRAIVDAATVGAACPGAAVLCGQVTDALARLGTFDLVVALDDVTRTQSLEAEPQPWLDLARAIAGTVAPGGTLLLGVENELGLHRLTLAENPFSRDGDGDWTPLATWDASRPRTRAQLSTALADLGVAGDVLDAHATFRHPTALGVGLDGADAALLDLLPALATQPTTEPAQGTTPVFLARSLALAGRLRDHCAGWIVVTGPPAAGVPRIEAGTASGEPVVWTASGPGAVTRTIGGLSRRVEVTGPARTLLARVTVACTDADLPELRALLTGWRAWLESKATDGVLPAEWTDARFGNVLPGVEWAVLTPGLGEARLDVVAWTALGDAFDVLRGQGVRLPWPTGLHPRTVLETMGAMAGLTPPADLGPYFRAVEPDPLYLLTRQELIATVRRQEAQLHGAWSRWTWDERRYATDRVIRVAKKAAQKGLLEGRKAADRLRGRTRRPGRRPPSGPPVAAPTPDPT